MNLRDEGNNGDSIIESEDDYWGNSEAKGSPLVQDAAFLNV